jgi:hypothetical protein
MHQAALSLEAGQHQSKQDQTPSYLSKQQAGKPSLLNAMPQTVSSWARVRVAP